MSAHAREHGTGAQWTHEAAIDDGIIRVRADRSTRWFITPDQPGTDVAEELHGFPSAAAGRVHDREGLLVPRCAGGLLDPALRVRGGMAPPLALGLLDEALELLTAAPAAPPGTSRVTRRALALDADGAVVLLPGRLRAAAARTDSAELGEILHLALTGRTWEETGVPLELTAPEVPSDVARLVTDLLEDTAGHMEPHSIRARICALGPSRDRGFLPAEPGVSEDAAPTATLGGDLVRELRGVPRAGRGAEAAPSSAGDSVRRERRRERRRPSTRAGRDRSRSPGRGRGRQIVVLAAGIGVCCGIILMIRSLTGADAIDPQAESLRTGATTGPVAGTDATDGAIVPTEDSADPASAVVALSRERALAIAEGDREALSALTVPGSPAAAADATMPLAACAAACPSPRALELTEIEVLEAPGGDAEDDGARAAVGATMVTEGEPGVPVIFLLERADSGWLVHSVEHAPA